MAETKKTARTSMRSAKKNAKMKKIPAGPAKPLVSDLIGQRLRTYYDEVAKQPVPDRFLDLLNQLEANSAPKKTR